jgi:hypothetical protein
MGGRAIDKKGSGGTNGLPARTLLEFNLQWNGF